MKRLIRRFIQRGVRTVLTVAFFVLLIYACATQTKLQTIKTTQMEADLTMSGSYESDLPELHVDQAKRDTLEIWDTDLDGNRVLIMNAVRNEDDALVVSEELTAAIITARFRNIAERNGKVDIRFRITVPKSMQDSKWQLRFYPDMYILEDSIRLEPVILTGRDYRKGQLRGYQQYDKFLSTIISDTTKFVNLGQLELYISRYFPKIYAFKTDSTYVSDEQWRSVYGTTEKEAIDHYTDQWAIVRNERRKARIGKMYKKYIKVPIVTEGLRLDTVLRDANGDFAYEYVQVINTRPKLKKVDVVISGDIYEMDKKLYESPRSKPLTFYISSLSSFVDDTERYMTKVIERKAEANSVCWIGFASGKSNVDRAHGNNEEEISRIEGNLRALVDNTVFDLDSITVTASASPEGSIKLNTDLSLRRAASVSDYFSAFLKSYRDSLKREAGFSLTVDDEFNETVDNSEKPVDIRFISHSAGENWDMFTRLISQDTVITDDDEEFYRKTLEIRDVDAREAELRKSPRYTYYRNEIYPYLRTVQFNFHLHRKGMIKDTVHTTVLDSVYMAGVQAIRDRDFETAVTILRPYNDYNTAVAYCAMDYNASAMSILEKLPSSDRVEYMMAIIYSRQNDDQEAVKHYLRAVRMNHSYVFRGNLDPEISVLIKKYGLNKEEDNDLGGA